MVKFLGVRSFQDDWNFAAHEDISILQKYQSSFQSNFKDECAIISSGPDCETNCSLDIYFQLITQAKEKVWIQTPYFIPPPSLISAFRAAVQKGVDVKLMVPAKNDIKIVGLASKSHYQSLLRSGVSIYEYQSSMLHSKVTIVDNHTFIGSANIDTRSFRLNFEVGCLFKSENATNKINQIFLKDLSNSRQITKSEVQNKPWTSDLK